MRWSRSGGEARDAQRTCCSCAHARLRERQSRYVRVRSRVAIRLELRRVPERERSRGDGLARPARRRRSRRVSNSLCVSLSLRILGFLSSHLLKILNGNECLFPAPFFFSPAGHRELPGPRASWTHLYPAVPDSPGARRPGWSQVAADGVGLSRRLRVNTQLKPSSSFNDPDCWSSCMMSRPPCSSPFT